MFYKLLNMLDKKVSFVTVSAKSTFKTYDPLSMQLAVLTMIRNTDLISELQHKPYLTINEQNHYTQLLETKLDNCYKINLEFVLLLNLLRQDLPQKDLMSVDALLAETFINAELNCHQMDKELSRSLLLTVNKLVEIYWRSRGVKTYFAKCNAPIDQSLCIRY